MFKKIAAVLLVISLIAALAACGGKSVPSAGENPGSDSPGSSEVGIAVLEQSDADTAYETYTFIAQKLSAQTGEASEYDIDFIMSMSMVYMGENMDFDMTGNIKMKTENDLVKYSMVMDMGEMGSMEMYCDGEKAYYVMDGEVMEIDMATLMDQISSSVNIPEFEKAAIKSSSMDETPDGTRCLIVIDGKALTNFIADAMGEDLSSLGESMELDLSDVEMSILTDAAGNPLTMDMSMSMKLAVEGETIEMDAAYEYIFNKLGSGVEIDLSAIAI